MAEKKSNHSTTLFHKDSWFLAKFHVPHKDSCFFYTEFLTNSYMQ
jgi:hypothetical protein